MNATTLNMLKWVFVIVGIITSSCVAVADSGDEQASVHLFYTPSCGSCRQTLSALQDLTDDSDGLHLVTHDLSEPQNVKLLTQFYQDRDVPEAQWNGTMAVFLGNRWWTDEEKALQQLSVVAKETPSSELPGPPSGDREAAEYPRKIALFVLIGAAVLYAAVKELRGRDNSA